MDVIVYDKINKESNKIIDYLFGLYPQPTIQNTNIASFSDGAGDIPIKSMSFSVEPVQDLHGYDSPWPAGGGKNKLRVTATTRTVNGITFTVNADGTILVNGTASGGNAVLSLINDAQEQALVDMDAEFILSGCPSGGSVTGYRLQWYLYETNKNAIDIGNGSTAFKPVLTDGNVSIVVNNGVSCNNLLFKPMIRLSSVADSTFYPYSNECPISGWTGANVEQRGKNLLPYPTTAPQAGSTFTQNGVTMTRNADGTLSFSGTASATTWFYFNTYSASGDYDFDFSPGEYIMSSGITDAGTGNSDYRLQMTVYRNDDHQILRTHIDAGNGVRFTINENEKEAIYLYIPSGKVMNGITLYPMLRLASFSDSAFAPYTPRTYPVTFPTAAGTVFGGEYDPVAKRLTVNKAEADAGSATWTRYDTASGYAFYTNLPLAKQGVAGSAPDFVMSNYKAVNTTSRSGFVNQGAEATACHVNDGRAIYVKDSNYTDAATFKTSMAGQQIVYELETPIVYENVEIEDITTYNGYNTFWVDTGNILNLTYRANLGDYINNQITIATANSLNL